MRPRSTTLASYQAAAAPLLNPNDPAYLAGELHNLELVISEIVLMTPQPTTEEPKTLRHGMQRLAMAPWRPLGDDADHWVWWDEGTRQWKML